MICDDNGNGFCSRCGHDIVANPFEICKALPKPKYSVTVTELYEGYPDFWSGHGHSFVNKNVKACMVLSLPINYSETVGDIIEGLVSEANQEWEYLADTTQAEIDGIQDQITDTQIEEAIREEFNLDDSESAFDLNAEEIMDEDQELPEILCILHVWREDLKDVRLTDSGKAFDGFFNLSSENRNDVVYTIFGVVKSRWTDLPEYARKIILESLDEAFDKEVKRITDLINSKISEETPK